MTDFPLVQGGKILCLACKEQGKIYYAGRITAKHLIGKHKSLFPNIKTAIQEYKKRYPEGGTAANDRTRSMSGPEIKITSQTAVIAKESLEWEKQNKQLFDELENIKKELAETNDPIKIKKLKMRKDLILGQQKVIKEITPARGSFQTSNTANAKLNPLQIKALEDITPLLKKISENLGCLREVDESVSKCLS
jgi:uncharacterized GH25 family protein